MGYLQTDIALCYAEAIADDLSLSIHDINLTIPHGLDGGRHRAIFEWHELRNNKNTYVGNVRRYFDSDRICVDLIGTDLREFDAKDPNSITAVVEYAHTYYYTYYKTHYANYC